MREMSKWARNWEDEGVRRTSEGYEGVGSERENERGRSGGRSAACPLMARASPATLSRQLSDSSLFMKVVWKHGIFMVHLKGRDREGRDRPLMFFDRG